MALFGITQAQSACNPNFLYILANLPGYWPNPQQGPLPEGDLGDPYSETITVIVPADTTIDVSQYGLPFGQVTVSINYIELSSITGLPAGLSYACDNANCTWNNNSNGCFKISGTPTQAGVFSVACNTAMNINIPNFGPYTTPPAPAAYDMTIDEATSTIDLKKSGWRIDGLTPNPSQGTSQLRFTAPKATPATLQIADITGRVHHQQISRTQVGENILPIDATQWAPGIYLCTLLVDGQHLSTKLIVE